MLIYYPILNNEFIYLWDDSWMIKNMYTENGFSLDNIISILAHFYHGQYAPLNELFYLFLYTLSNGYNSFIFHFACLILHICNTFVVFFFIKKLLSFKIPNNIKLILHISFVTALIFAIHPLNVESVAWMSASKVLIYALFYLLGGISFLYYIENNKFKYYIITIICFFFSFAGKEQAVTYPLMLCLLYYFLQKDLFCRNRIILWNLLPFFLLSVFFGLITYISQEGTGSQYNNFSVIERIIYASYALIEYICKCIFPIKLLYLYPFMTLPGEQLPGWLMMYPPFLCIVFIAFKKYIHDRYIIFGVIFFLLHLTLVIHIIPMSRFAVIADRYMYLSTIGFGFLYGYILFKNILKTTNTKWIYTIFLLSILYLGYLGTYSHIRTFTWKDSNSLKYELRELLEDRNK